MRSDSNGIALLTAQPSGRRPMRLMALHFSGESPSPCPRPQRLPRPQAADGAGRDLPCSSPATSAPVVRVHRRAAPGIAILRRASYRPLTDHVAVHGMPRCRPRACGRSRGIARFMRRRVVRIVRVASGPTRERHARFGHAWPAIARVAGADCHRTGAAPHRVSTTFGDRPRRKSARFRPLSQERPRSVDVLQWRLAARGPAHRILRRSP